MKLTTITAGLTIFAFTMAAQANNEQTVQGNTNAETSSMGKPSASSPPGPETGTDASLGVDNSTAAATSLNSNTTDVETTAGINQNQQAQMALNTQLGLTLTTDGVVGPQTRAALRRFQNENGLTPNGVLDTETLQALGLDRTNREPASVPATQPPTDY